MSEALDPALVIVRFLVFGLAMLAFGRAAFDLYAPAPRRSGRWRVAIGAPLAIAAVAYAVFLARNATGEPGWPGAAAVVTIWSGTGFGRAIAATTVAGAALAALGLARRPTGWLAAGLAAIALCALAFVGHGADDAGWRSGARIALLALHLLAVAAWLGALPALWRALGDPGQPLRLVERFGLVGAMSVAVMLLTGVATLIFIALGGGLGGAYLETLAVKLAFVLGLLAIAAVNRFRLTPLMAREPDRARRLLRRTIVAEQALGLGALACVALLGQLDPAM